MVGGFVQCQLPASRRCWGVRVAENRCRKKKPAHCHYCPLLGLVPYAAAVWLEQLWGSTCAQVSQKQQYKGDAATLPHSNWPLVRYKNNMVGTGESRKVLTVNEVS